MPRPTLIALTSLALAACSQPAHHAIIGTWRSDAPKTLESAREQGALPAEGQEPLGQDVYGHLIVEYRVDTVRAWFDNTNYDSGYRPYEVVEVTDAYVVTREWNEILKEFETSTTWVEGDCIFGKAEAGFREYFCPLSD